MELHPASRLTPDADPAALSAPASAPDTAPLPQRAYLAGLPLSESQRAALSQATQASGSSTPEAAFGNLHLALAALGSCAAALPDPALSAIAVDDPAQPVLASVSARLALAEGPLPPNPSTPAPRQPSLLPVMPAIHRSAMVPKDWDDTHVEVDAPNPRGDWQSAGSFRRLLLLGLMLAQTAVATYVMADVLPYHGASPLEMAILTLFAILFCWVSAGFWTAMTGFLVLLLGGDRYTISASSTGEEPIADDARTAIIMPICNEDVSRVFAGLRATWQSLVQTGKHAPFDLYILSDSGDPDIRAAEQQAWDQLCREVEGFGRIYYRWRARRVKRKTGNVADFCRRWGSQYRYMIVLDADSVMSGDCLTRMVQLMEANPGAALIQTAPLASGRDTFYARVQQFATRVYGPLFTAGLHYWQLGESHYWGHNAIIRMAPFIKHCALAPLPGKGALSGEILSHDFVEAALLRRAGWGVWIAYDLLGSYEEMPPNLLDELKRDRRWCHGNLMNVKLFFVKGMHSVHRAVFITGVMAYLSAPLWFLFLILSTVLLATHTLAEPQYFFEPRQLFPVWPEWHPEKAIALFGATATLLFLPKILSVLLLWVQGAQSYGGKLRLAGSMLIEMVFSALLAPVRMLFHTQFVLAALIGWAIHWKSPPREDTETTWTEALQRHGLHTLLGAAWASLIYWLDPDYLWWLLPIVGALVLSVPMSGLSSRVSLGRGLRRLGFFLIPEEATPPRELRWTQQFLEASPEPGTFLKAVLNPVDNALACAVARARAHETPAFRARRQRLVRTALISGPALLNARQKLALLSDPIALAQLHQQVWSQASAQQLWEPDEAHFTQPS